MQVKHANRLINEKSPYLLQHANNPVDWYPWGDEAFEKAKREDKPIFLSLGYSTCHWCHVMERESFEDEEVANILNKHYVSIKVDREERPDVDTIYMAVCQAMTGHGGWPLTIIMTPERNPFFAGTYFPKSSGRGMPGLISILNKVADLWANAREALVKSGEQITEAMSAHTADHNPGEITEETLQQAFDYYQQTFDTRYGGFGSAPKFPTPHNLMFLLRYWKTTDNEAALNMVERTLDMMYRGGIYDHIGFGFARYSTDRRWLVPHFEKMLYDNALLALAYLEAFQATGKQEYAKPAREIFTYVLREMTYPQGGFYSAEDADSEGVEGKFYVWTPEEVKEVLGETLGRHYCQDFDITGHGNFEGKNIPNLISTGFVDGYSEAREKLFNARENRVHPFKDDKILTAWNGLMIAALSFGARVLNEPAYLEAAEKAARFTMQNLRQHNGRLLARYRDGEAAHLAYIDDYAFLIWGLIELYQSGFNTEYLETAIELTKNMIKLFWDQEQGGFFLYGSDSEALITRPKEIYDGATPSGNSVAALNLLRLARLTGDEALAETAQHQLKAFGKTVDESPVGYSYFLMAAWFNITPPIDVTIAGDINSQGTKEMLHAVNSRFLPENLVNLNSPGKQGEKLRQLIPSLNDKTPVQDATTAYVCNNFTCHAPVTNLVNLEELLKQKNF